jgi:hypothetical protein
MRKLLALLAFAAVAVSCSNDTVTDPDSVFGLALNVTPAQDTLVATTQVQLQATATRSGVPLTSLPGHVWESSNQSVALVDQNGKVTAVAPGTADIAVRVNTVRGYATVVVIAATSSGSTGGTGGTGGTTTPGVFLGGGPGSIASGLDATCGIVTGGQTWCFGKAPLIGVAKDTSCFGRVGEWDEKKAPCSLVPLQIAGALSLSSLTVGDSVACGLAASGAAYCWGDQTYGELGNGIAADGKSSLPVRVTGPLTSAATFTQVSAGGSHVCALVSGGSAYCWGRDDALQLGGGDMIKANASTPVTAAPGKAFKQIASGRSFTCGLQTDGVTFCWGDNEYGQLGRGTSGDTTENFVAVIAPAFTQISARGDNACGLTSAGTIYCWGDNRTGQTGRLPGGITSTPNQVAGSGYTYVAVGGRDSTIADGAVGHVCALAGTTVSCWGSNRYGQLGRNIAPGNLLMSSTPVAITGTYTALSSGTRTSCAVAADGLYCWGSSLWGATGNQVQAVAVPYPAKAQPPQ